VQDGGTHLQTSKVDICSRNVGYHCNQHRVALRGRRLCVESSGLHLAAVFAKEVDLPDGVETSDLVDVLQAAGAVSRDERLIRPAPSKISPGTAGRSPAGLNIWKSRTYDCDLVGPSSLQTVECDLQIRV